MIALRDSPVTEQTGTMEACLRRHRLLHPWVRCAYHRNIICFLAFVPMIPVLIMLLTPDATQRLRWGVMAALFVLAGIYRASGIVNAVWEKNVRRLAETENPLALGALLDFAEIVFRASQVPAENYVEEERQILTLHLPNLVRKVQGGDYPELTLRQRNSLRWLVHHRYFGRYLCGEELPDRIRMILVSER